MHWLQAKELIGENVSLVPLSLDHENDLVKAASDGELWKLWYTFVPNQQTIKSYIEFALDQQQKGLSLPFTVIENKTNKVIGSTRYCHADIENKRLEIGYTWYAKSYQRTTVNTECKLLLLSYAFEQLKSIAVEFRTHWHNQASRKAIARLGAKQDGILRQHMLMPNGTYRDTVVFSILNSEWSAVKTNLEFQMKRWSQQ